MPFAGKKGVMSRLMSRVADITMATPDADTPSIEGGYGKGRFPTLNQANAIDLVPPPPPDTTSAFITAANQRDSKTMNDLTDIETGSRSSRDKMKKNLGR